jgi:linoleate 10R-lipoxygenase
VDIELTLINSVGDMTALYFASALFCIPLKSEDNPHGSFDERELFRIFANANIYMFFDHDPTKTWARRRDAKAGLEALAKKMVPLIEEMARTSGLGIIKGLKEGAENVLHGAKSPMAEYGKTFVKSLLKQGDSAKDVAWLLIGLATAFIANSAQAVSRAISSYFAC